MIKTPRSLPIEPRSVLSVKTHVIILTARQANIKLEAYGYAIADATKAIELDESYVKVSDGYLELVTSQNPEKCLSIA